LRGALAQASSACSARHERRCCSEVSSEEDQGGGPGGGGCRGVRWPSSSPLERILQVRAAEATSACSARHERRCCSEVSSASSDAAASLVLMPLALSWLPPPIRVLPVFSSPPAPRSPSWLPKPPPPLRLRGAPPVERNGVAGGARCARTHARGGAVRASVGPRGGGSRDPVVRSSSGGACGTLTAAHTITTTTTATTIHPKTGGRAQAQVQVQLRCRGGRAPAVRTGTAWRRGPTGGRARPRMGPPWAGGAQGERRWMPTGERRDAATAGV
jgi:hypothetical protein